MYQKIVSTDDDSGLSPVIGVILMVALVVALVALVSITVFDITDESNSDDSVAGSSIDFTATTDGVKVTVVRQGDADEFIVKVDGEEVGDRLQESGDSTTIQAEGVYSVVGDFGDSQEVIVSKEVTGTINGLFTVFQDQEDGTVEAQLVERYENEDEYELVVNSDGSTDDGSTTSFDLEETDDGRLLSSGESQLLQSIPETVPSNAAKIVGMATEKRAQELGNNAPPIKVGEKAQVHKMLGGWCKGDDLLLVGEDGETVLDGEEFEFDNNCGALQTVPEYSGGEITGVKLVNLWNQEIDYSMYSFKGQVEPPKRGIATGGNYDVNVEVYKQDGSGNIDTSAPIEDAKVVIGNKAGPTDASGLLEVNGIPNGQNYFVTVNADGFDGTQSTFTIEGADDGTSFNTMNFDAVSGEPNGEKLDDDAIYNVKDGSSGDAQKELQIGLKEFNPEVKVIQSSSISGGQEKSISLSSGTTAPDRILGVSGGTTSSDSGSSGFTSSGGGSVSSGSTVYSGGGTTTTQTLSTTTKSVSESSSYSPEPPNNDVDTTASSETIDLPSRTLSVGQIDKSDIPQGQAIKIKTTAQSYSDKEVTDTIQVYYSEVTSGSSNTELTPIEQRDITLPPGSPGNEVSETIQFDLTATDDASNPGSWEAGKEYNVYVALKSVGNPKEAGTLNVFDSSLTSANLDLSSSSVTLTNTNRDLDNGLVGDDVKVELNSVTSTTGATVDLYKNGKLVKRVKNYDGSQDPITYTETINDPKFVDYHVGIKEATKTGLLDTAIISELSDGADSTAFDGYTIDPQISVKDSTNKCDDLTEVSSSYDCNVELPPTGPNDVVLVAGGTYDTGSGQISDSNLQLDMSVGTAASFTDLSIGQEKVFDLTTAEDQAYLAELTATVTDGNGNSITKRDTYVLNAYTSVSEITSQVTGVTTPGDDEFTVQLESDRASINEDVNVVIESDTGNSDAAGSYIVSDKTIRPDVTEEVTVTVPEIAYSDSGGTGDIYSGSASDQDSAIAALTESDGSVPFSVKLQDASDNSNVSGTSQTFTINPDGEIEADITADVRVNECPDGSSPVTVSGASSGTCDVTVLSTDDGTDDLTFRFGQFGYNNPDRFEVINPSGNIVNSGSGTFTTGNSQGDDIQVSPVESGVYEVVFYDSSGNSRVVESIDTTEVSP